MFLLRIIDFMALGPIIGISADRGIPRNQLDKLARETGLPLASPSLDSDYLLHITTDKLILKKVSVAKKKTASNSLSISIDFTQGKTQHRRLQGGGKWQNIAKAIGLNKIAAPHVLDLSAGMGGDAFVLASLGATMILLERHCVVHALLKDAVARASLVLDEELQQILARFQVINADAQEYLEALRPSELPDVIYFDPMFPSRSKSAQVKKEMQFFHEIVGEDNDSESIFLKALGKAQKRIVIKRPRLARSISEEVAPNFDILGKTTRYDIYLPR